MAIKVGGKLVAGGRGADGKSAYQYAVDGGYTGTEAEFRALMGSGPWLPLAGGTLSGTGSLTVKKIIVNSDSNGNIMQFGLDVLNSVFIGKSTSGNIAVSTGIGGAAKIENVKYPENPSDAATKSYVDDSIASAIDDSWAVAY